MSLPPTAQQERATRVFLSYSRKDGRFVHVLAERLTGKGYVPIFDVSDEPHLDDPDLVISAQDEWWLAVERMIAASDVMVFIATPASAASRVCDDEIAHAKRLGRRVIPILRGAIDFDSAPERLRALNVKLNFASGDDTIEDAAFDLLVQEIERDIEWHRQSARLIRLAQQWHMQDRPKGDLLRAGAIADAERWAARRPGSAPEPGELVLAYLDASKALETADRNTLLRGVANGFAVRADQAATELRTEHASKCVGAAAVLAEDIDYSAERARHAWRLGAHALLQNNQIVFGDAGEPIMDAQWSNDSETIVTASEKGTVRLWRARDGKEIRSFKARGGAVRACLMMPDGETLATGSDDGAVRLWDVKTGECRHLLKRHSGRVMALACAPDGAWVASAGNDARIAISDTKSGEQRYLLEGHTKEIMALNVSRDGGVLASAGQDGRARTWDVGRGRALVKAEFASEILATGFVSTSAEISPDGDWILSGSPTGEVAIWNARTGALRASKRCHKDGAFCASFSPDGERFVSAAYLDRTAKVWDTQTFDLVSELAGDGAGIWLAKFSPDGSRIATIDIGEDANLWDASTGQMLRRYAGHERSIKTLAFAPNGRRLLTADLHGRATIWDASCGPVRSTVHVENAALVDAYLGDATERLATIGRDKRARLWTSGGEIVAEIGSGAVHPQTCAFSHWGDRLVVAIPGERPVLMATSNGERLSELDWIADWTLAPTLFSRCGRWVVVSSKQGAVCFDTKTAKPVFEIAPETGVWAHAAFSVDGARFIIGGEDGQVAIAALDQSWRTIETKGHHRSITFVDISEDGRLGASCGWDGAVRIWDMSTGDQLKMLNIPPSGKAIDAAFFVERDTVLVCARDGRTLLINWITGQEVSRLPRLAGLKTLAISPHRNLLATAGWDGLLQVWEIATGVELARTVGAWSSISACRFGLDGDHLYVNADAQTGFVWDFRRELGALICARDHPGVVAAAALSCGAGLLGEEEHKDFLFAEAPRDLGPTLLERLDREHASLVSLVSSILRGPRPEACYAAPSAQRRVLDHPGGSS